MLARGWVPSARLRTAALFVVAVALLTAPVWMAVLHVGEPSVTYRAVPVTATDETLRFADGPIHLDRELGRTRDVENLACEDPVDDSRPCVVDRALAGGRRIAVNASAGGLDPGTSGELSVRIDEEFTVVDGRLYRRTARAANGTLVLGLERVTPETFLNETARDAGAYADRESLRSAEPATYRAARTGVATSYGSAAPSGGRTSQLFETDDGYVLVKAAERDPGWSETARTLAAAGGFVLGARLLLRGRRT
ncbi:hypothetical protein [Halomarina pelagica]|uniref:hypothetical protein n=1 Tax=Halomarina pelagica TaxID=2961599 RepID=UPI0020C48FFB|nr:hypothetical protein [Halomarina sp. BND7]